MAIHVGVAGVLFQAIALFLILLLLGFVVPKLQPILYTTLFFMFFYQLTVHMIMPFGKTISSLFEPLPAPYPNLLIGSAILFFISDLISRHFEEAGYKSLAAASHLSIKIGILTLWLPETEALIDILTALISK